MFLLFLIITHEQKVGSAKRNNFPLQAGGRCHSTTWFVTISGPRHVYTNRNEMPCRSTTPSASIGGRPIICPKWKEWWTMGRVYYFKHRKEKRSVIGGVLRNALNNLRWKWHKMTTCEQGRWVENELHTASSQIEKPVRKASFFFRLQAWSTSKSTSRGEQRLQKQNGNIPLSEISKWHIIL